MHNEMTAHIFSCEELSITIVTSELLIRIIFNSATSSMDFKVINYILPGGKILITYLTLKITFLSRMQGSMFSVAQEGRVGFPAIWPFTCIKLFNWIMHSDMVGEMILTIESLTTNIARKGSSLTMYEIVSHKLELGVEALVTQVAGERQLASVREDMLAELTRAGEAFVAGAADMALGVVLAGTRLPGLGQRGAGRAALALSRPPRQRGDAPSHLDRAEQLLDAAGARRSERHVLQLRGQLRRGRRYERLLRGGRAFPARLLFELGAALLAFLRVRWRAGHLAHIFDALALYRRSLISRRTRIGSAVALARRDGRKHFCHIDGLEALFRIRVTWFSRNFSYPQSNFTQRWVPPAPLRHFSIEKTE